MKFYSYEISGLDSFYSMVEDITDKTVGLNISGMVFHVYFGDINADTGEKIFERLDEAFPKAIKVGIAANAGIIQGRTTNGSTVISVMIFGSSTAGLFYKSEMMQKEKDTGKEAAAFVDSLSDVKAVEILFCCRSDYGLEFLEEFEKCNKEVFIFGGMPMGRDMFKDPKIITVDGQYTENGVAVIAYCGDDLHVDGSYEAGWSALGKEMEITKAHGYTIEEIDDRLPTEIYEHYLGIEADEDFERKAVEFPLQVRKGSGEMLRHIMKLEEDGSVECAGYVQPGMKVRISYADPEQIIGIVNRRSEELVKFAPEALLIYSCAVRKAFWGNFYNNEIKPMEEISSSCGFCTGGEFSRDKKTGEIMWHNITMLTVGFREGEPCLAKVPPKINIGISDKNAFMIKRLVTLVKATTAELKEVAIRDGLTGLYNRRQTEDFIEADIERLHKGKLKHLSLIMIDADDFKSINDTFGHNIGDEVLKALAGVLKKHADQTGGYAGRWGGEEFFVALPDFDKKAAIDVAEKMRKDIESLDIEGARKFTASFGVVTSDTNVDWKVYHKRMFIEVDDALYEAKRTGKNKVVARNFS